MATAFIDDQSFQGVHFTLEEWKTATYEDCSFEECTFQELDFTDCRFINCLFQDCNLSNVKFLNTSFQEVEMRNCKAMGLMFEQCADFSFGIQFLQSVLNHSSFYQVNLQRSTFIACSLVEVDFTEANLGGVDLVGRDFQNATFDQTKLERTQIKNARNLRLDPEINAIQGASLSVQSLPGLLTKYGLRIIE